MWRRKAHHYLLSSNFSSQSEIPTLYSFLQPSIFSLNKSITQNTQQNPTTTTNTLTQTQKSNIETCLKDSLFITNNTDEAWKSFKTLTSSSSCLPSKDLTNSLITHLSSQTDTLNLKRAFASMVFILEKNPSLLEFDTVKTLLDSMSIGINSGPVFALVKSMLKNRFFMPFEMWGSVLVDMCRKDGSFVGFLGVFNESCRIAIDEKMDFMKPDLAACNAVLEYYCREVESVVDAEKVMETMSILGVRPDETSFGLLAYLYAVKGVNEKVIELESLLGKFGMLDKSGFLHNLVCAYVKSNDLESVSATVLRGLEEGQSFRHESFNVLVKGFMDSGNYKDLASLIVHSQKLEPSTIVVEKSFGYGVISACISLGLLDKAHSILDEMNAQSESIGLGVYVPILKSYSKDQKTAEAAQLVTEIVSLGLRLDVQSYDTLIETSMSCQDFQSVFSIFRDMRESRTCDLKGSYLTIMTGLTENRRPELMATFLDEVVDDPRIDIGIHDWNSIIHAFCKTGRLEDARRTFRRMTFLRFEPNHQTYLSLINGYVNAEKYFSVLMLWNEVKRKSCAEGERKFKLDTSLVDAFLFALVKGGFFDAVMQVVEKSQEMKIFVDKWRYKQAFMEKHKKLKVSKLRKRNVKKMESLIAFKNWAGLSS